MMATSTYEQLLSTLTNANGSGELPFKPEELLAELAHKDPKTWMLVQLLNQRQVEEDKPTPPPLPQKDPERVGLFTEVRQYIEQTHAELEQLRSRNDQLAAALGACGLCWGEDLTCPVCGGRGHPGAEMPNVAQLRRFVLPALQQLRESKNSLMRQQTPIENL